jgi:predicted DNA-binding transcriptional regulator AlpA
MHDNSTALAHTFPRLLSRDELHALLRPGMRPTSFFNWLWKATRLHQFPRPLVIAGRTVAWREDEVGAWIESRPRSSRENGPRRQAA